MKRIFAILALLGAVGMGAPAWAEEKQRLPRQLPPSPQAALPLQPRRHRPAPAEAPPGCAGPRPLPTRATTPG